MSKKPNSKVFIVLIILAAIGGTGILINKVLDKKKAEANKEILIKLFSEIQPVSLKNCKYERFGKSADEGYLLCGNLLSNIKSIYSYGIEGRDLFGCETSEKLRQSVHEYDCFDLRKPVCEKGDLKFHEECISGEASTDLKGRVFDTFENQLKKNGDNGKTLLVKIDIEGAEWNSLLQTPDHVLEKIDQMALELHLKKDMSEYVQLIQKLKKHFYINYLHYNNHGCSYGKHAPFPSKAFQVLLVNKKIGILEEGKKPNIPQNLIVPDAPGSKDCQTL